MDEQRDKEPESRESEAGGRQAEEAEMMEHLQEEIRNLPVSDHLLYMMQSLSGLAIARMGLTDDTASRRDMPQARLAVDAFKALLDLLERAKPSGEMAAHRGMLSQLQLAYVGALDGGSTAVEEPQKQAEQEAADAAEEEHEKPGEEYEARGEERAAPSDESAGSSEDEGGA